MQTPQQSKAYRDKWRVNGQCTRCGREREGAGLVCLTCRNKEKQNQLRRRRHKLCIKCGKPADNLILGDNYKTCGNCRYAKRQLYKVKTEQGLCYCGRPLANGKRNCDKCLNVRSERCKRHRQHGFCSCGRIPVLGKRSCKRCQDYTNRLHAILRAKGVCQCGDAVQAGAKKNGKPYKSCGACLVKARERARLKVLASQAHQ